MLLGDTDDVAWSTIDVRKYVLFGGAFTLAVDAAVYPMELIKTRAQVETQTRPSIVRATLNAFSSTLRKEGIAGLYKGFWLYTLGGLPSQGAYFLGYSFAKEKLAAANTRTDGSRVLPEPLVYMGAGLFADIVAAPLWTPADVIMQRMQIQGPGVTQYRSVWHAVELTWKHEGVRGLWRGLGASIITFGPASALWWALYEGTAKLLFDWRERSLAAERTHTEHAAPATPAAAADGATTETGSTSNVPWIHAVAGFVAGAVSSVLTNPLDIAKTRLQTQHSMVREFAVESAVQLHAALRERLERDLAEKKSRKLQFFRSLQDERHRQREPGGPRVSSTTEIRVSADVASKPREHGPAPAPTTTTSPNVRQTIAARAAAAAATAVGAVNTAAETLHAHAAPRAAVPTTPSRPAPSIAATALPSIGAVPYQSTISRDPKAIEAAASSTRSALIGAEADRLGRARKAPDSGALAAAAKGDRQALLKYYPKVGPKLPNNIFAMLAHMMRTEGPGSLVRGMLPRVLLHGPASAATFVCYEQVMRLSRKSDTEGMH